MKKISFYPLAILTLFLPIQNLIVNSIILRFNLPIYLALWKEGLAVFLIIIWFLSFFSYIGKAGFTKKTFSKLWFLPIWLAVNVFAILASFVWNETNPTVFLYGFRFELFWGWFLVAGIAWVRVMQDLSEQKLLIKLRSLIEKCLFAGLGFVLVFITLTSFWGEDFLRSFGYGATANSGNIITPPACHYIDYGIDNCRLAAPFSSPNHLSAYLIFMIGFVSSWCYRHYKSYSFSKIQVEISRRIDQLNIFASAIFFKKLYLVSIYAVFFGVLSILIFQTFSRSAMLALAVLIVFMPLILFKKSLGSNLYKVLAFLFLLLPVVFSAVIININPEYLSSRLPVSIAKPSSSAEHYRLTGLSLEILSNNPVILLQGVGLGATGPAAKEPYQSPQENRFIQRFATVSYKWFIPENRMAVPENWYLQLISNGGLIYAILWLSVILLPLYRLWGAITLRKYTVYLLLAMFGVVLINFFLHIWENQTIALYWGILSIWLEITGRISQQKDLS